MPSEGDPRLGYQGALQDPLLWKCPLSSCLKMKLGHPPSWEKTLCREGCLSIQSLSSDVLFPLVSLLVAGMLSGP